MAKQKKESSGFHVYRMYNANPGLYDMVLNQARLSMDSIVDLVVRGMQSRGLIKTRDAAAPAGKKARASSPSS